MPAARRPRGRRWRSRRNPMSASARALCARSAASSPPCTMPNSARPGGALSKARLQRSAQRERQPHGALELGRACSAARCTRRAASTMSAPSSVWISMARSGDRSTMAPSRCERKVTPLFRRCLRSSRQRHHLEAAGIGEDRPRPVHELVQAAERRRSARRPAAASGDRCCRAGCRRRSRARPPAPAPSPSPGCRPA